MLDKSDAQAFLRQNFDMDVEPNDVLVVMYMLGELSQKNLKESNREVGSKIATDVVLNSHDVLKNSHGSLVEVSNHIAAMQEAMKSTIQAAEKAETLNAMLDEKTAAMSAMFDEKIAALDERLDRTSKLAHKMTEMADKTVQAVVALTSGLLSVKTKGGFWKK